MRVVPGPGNVSATKSRGAPEACSGLRPPPIEEGSRVVRARRGRGRAPCGTLAPGQHLMIQAENPLARPAGSLATTRGAALVLLLAAALGALLRVTMAVLPPVATPDSTARYE